MAALKETSEPTWDLSELQSLDGATDLRLPPGQVLLYREHVPPGVFVLVSGIIEVPEERGHHRPSPWRLEALTSRPALLPDPAALEEPSPETWVVSEPARVLYLPRTLVQETPELQARLRTLAKG